MEPTQPSSTEKYWLPIFVVIPVVCAMQFGKAYVTDGGMQILYSALAGGVSGLLGFAGYYFTAHRSVPVRIFVLTAVALAALLPSILLTPSSDVASSGKASYSTCPVCGYVAYKADEKVCDNCGEELTAEELRESGLPNMDSLIRLDQAFYFIPDDEKTPVTFNQPAISEDGFNLDNSWKPGVSEAAVKAQATQYYEHRKRNPIKVQVIKQE